MLRPGIEIFCVSPPPAARQGRIGLLSNQASTDSAFVHSAVRIQQAMPGRLSCLFSPQHGFFAEKQDDMVESEHGRTSSGLPIFSLYGTSRRPTPAMLEYCDVLVVDLQDVGTRVYTFAVTMLFCMEAAASRGIPVIVLDRPNPIGGLLVEGNVLDDDLRSFVGPGPIPMRHGMTMGELALFFNKYMGTGCDLTVVAMEGWHRAMMFPDTGLPWVMPSPNMPSFDTALVYPGQVIWEGSNISEGRGTTRPFEIFGAPFIDPERLSAALPAVATAGCVLRPLAFEPTFQKWEKSLCRGFFLHVTNSALFRPYRLSLSLFTAISELWPKDFLLKNPPYEYETEKRPMDLILGDKKLAAALAAGTDIQQMEESFQPELEAFAAKRQDVLIYRNE